MWMWEQARIAYGLWLREAEIGLKFDGDAVVAHGTDGRHVIVKHIITQGATDT